MSTPQGARWLRFQLYQGEREIFSSSSGVGQGVAKGWKRRGKGWRWVIGAFDSVGESGYRSGHAINAEVAQDHFWVANSYLDVRFVFESGTGIHGFAFFENPVDSVVTIHPFTLPNQVDHLDDGAVELAPHENSVLGGRILW